jgi:methionine biosynthesis protein MetW
MARRVDFDVIADIVPPGARVLDVGCGEGELLEKLARERAVIARGLELSQAGVNAAVARGLSVVQGDADADLAFYPDDAFDVVIISMSIQATRRPLSVLKELLRIGRRAIVSLPNFGHWRVALSLLKEGRMPVTPALPASWHETENIHLCTLKDFAALAEEAGARVEQVIPIAGGKAQARVSAITPWVGWRAQDAVFVLGRANG